MSEIGCRIYPGGRIKISGRGVTKSDGRVSSGRNKCHCKAFGDWRRIVDYLGPHFTLFLSPTSLYRRLDCFRTSCHPLFFNQRFNACCFFGGFFAHLATVVFTRFKTILVGGFSVTKFLLQLFLKITSTLFFSLLVHMSHRPASNETEKVQLSLDNPTPPRSRTSRTIERRLQPVNPHDAGPMSTLKPTELLQPLFTTS